MKTLKELKADNAISTRLYNSLLRELSINFYRDNLSKEEIERLTAKDVFDILGEERIKKARNLGEKSFKELKGLI